MSQEFYAELEKIQGKVADHMRQLQTLKGQNQMKQRDLRSTELTIADLDQFKDAPGVDTYLAVGKAYYMHPRDMITETLRGNAKKLEGEIAVIKNSTSYVEKQVQSARGAFQELVKAGQRG